MSYQIHVSEYNVPIDVVDTVKSICKGYKRRETEIRFNSKPENVIATYKMLNEAIDKAASVIDVGMRDEMLKDVANGIGFKYTPIYYASRCVYYRTKKKFIHDVAVELGLWNPLIITKPKRH